jgi:hypothetical protein
VLCGRCNEWGRTSNISAIQFCIESLKPVLICVTCMQWHVANTGSCNCKKLLQDVHKDMAWAFTSAFYVIWSCNTEGMSWILRSQHINYQTYNRKIRLKTLILFVISCTHVLPIQKERKQQPFIERKDPCNYHLAKDII